jgi:uncharacterized repeat protein (TIGR03837 family)
MLWDIFCRVIDNFGDIGVCWRLSADLAARGHTIRLWTDDASALQWMAPGATNGQWNNIQVLPWTLSIAPDFLQTLPPAQVWIESFGCDIPTVFLQHFAAPVWINLEYLSAEPYVQRVHGLPSPVLQGPAQGATKTFFYPGFDAKTGGLLRESDLAARQARFDASAQAQWLQQWGICKQPQQLLISLFCYEPPALEKVLRQFMHIQPQCTVLVTHGRATQAMQQLSVPTLEVVYLPPLSQTDYDHLLWACDINFVRGEDSLVRGLWAGKPLIWNIYPQQDGAHIAKLDAFLEVIQAPIILKQLHQIWNGTPIQSLESAFQLPPLPEWQQHMHTISNSLRELNDLSNQLLAFVQKKVKM